jgi:hypothetical protein
MRCARTLLVAPLLLAGLSSGIVAQDRPYTDGPVVNLSYVRIKPGMFDKYVKYPDAEYKRTWRHRRRPALSSTTPCIARRKAAALDSLRDRTELIAVRALNATPEQLTQASIERGAMRDLVGSRLLRQLILK